MKILHVVHAYTPSIGGSQWMIQKISEVLVADFGDDVQVYTTNTEHIGYFWGEESRLLPVGEQTVNGVKVRRFAVYNGMISLRRLAAGAAYRLRLPGNDRLRALHNGPLIPGLKKAVQNSGAKIVMAMAFPLLHMFAAMSGAKQGNLPILFCGGIHAGDDWGFNRPMIYDAIRNADGYFALTEFEKQHLVSQNVDPQKIVVIGGGVDPEQFALTNADTAKTSHDLENTPVILSIGKQNHRKRYDLLLRAMTTVWEKYPGAQLVIAGAKGSFSTELKIHLQNLDAPQRKNTNLITDFTEAEKPAIIAAADIFVLPSAEESFGLVFAEAWASGKPVIGARVGAIASLITENRDGLLFDSNDPGSLAKSILTMLDNPEVMQQMGESGREKVLKHHTWRLVAQRIRSTYEKILAGRSG